VNAADRTVPGTVVELVRADGSTEAVETRAGETVLEAGERVEEPLPFGCRTGACGTCTARLLEGEVRHERRPRALKDRHLEDGYVLTCVAVPRGDCRLRVGSDVLAETKPNPWK
jgi:ferredoxin